MGVHVSLYVRGHQAGTPAAVNADELVLQRLVDYYALAPWAWFGCNHSLVPHHSDGYRQLPRSQRNRVGDEGPEPRPNEPLGLPDKTVGIRKASRDGRD
jgi:hypothetical protein